MLPEDSKSRKETPIFSGMLMYFPDACAAVARLSFKANEKHNPGEPMHWSKDKSNDHADCAVRHLMTSEEVDEFGELHATCAAWRALAHLQTILEKPERQSINDVPEFLETKKYGRVPLRDLTFMIRNPAAMSLSTSAVPPNTVVRASLLSRQDGKIRWRVHGAGLDFNIFPDDVRAGYAHPNIPRNYL